MELRYVDLRISPHSPHFRAGEARKLAPDQMRLRGGPEKKKVPISRTVVCFTYSHKQGKLCWKGVWPGKSLQKDERLLGTKLGVRRCEQETDAVFRNGHGNPMHVYASPAIDFKITDSSVKR